MFDYWRLIQCNSNVNGDFFKQTSLIYSPLFLSGWFEQRITGKHVSLICSVASHVPQSISWNQRGPSYKLV